MEDQTNADPVVEATPTAGMGILGNTKNFLILAGIGIVIIVLLTFIAYQISNQPATNTGEGTDTEVGTTDDGDTSDTEEVDDTDDGDIKETGYTPTVPDGWTVKTSSECNIKIPMPPAKADYSKNGDVEMLWGYNESVIPSNERAGSLFHVYASVDHNPYMDGGILGSGEFKNAVSVGCYKSDSDISLSSAVSEIKKYWEDQNTEEYLDAVGPDGKFVFKTLGKVELWGSTAMKYELTGGVGDSGQQGESYIFVNNGTVYSIEMNGPLSKVKTIFDNLEFL